MTGQELIDLLSALEDKEAEIEMCVMDKNGFEVHFGPCDTIIQNTDGNTIELWQNGFYTN